jgi:hypothetical protein
MKLVSIGFIGGQTVYVGLTKEEAIQRYDKENPDYTVLENSLSVREIEVKDKFFVYDIWGDN